MRWRLTNQFTKRLFHQQSNHTTDNPNTTLEPNTAQQTIFRQHLANYMLIIRLMLLAIVIFLSYRAYQAFSIEKSANGFIPLAVASLIFIIITWHLPLQVQTNKLPQLEQPLPRRRVKLLGILWFIISAFCLWQSARIFLGLQPGQTPDQRPWQYFATGIILLIIVGFSLTPSVARRFRPDFLTILLFVSVIGLALFLRLYLFNQLPYGIWFDEAINGLLARDMIHKDNFRPIFIENMTQIHLWLYKTTLSWFGETSITALRSTSVAFGVGTVAAGFLVGHELRGKWFGFLIAFFLATMSWSINFSRIAMTGIETGFFTLLAFLFLLRILRYGYWRDALWLGLTVGFGLWFYSAFRFVLIALAIFAFLNIRRWRKRTLALGTFSTLIALIILFPLIIFINDNTDQFLYRSREVNILDSDNRIAPSLTEGLINNTQTHLQMFHIRGDWNGRHNLPNQPMLDPIMGILLILGFGLSIRYFRHTEEWFFVLLFIVSLLPGILTVEFEAPQALRTIGILPAIAYFCALAVFALAKLLHQSNTTKPLLLGIVVLLGASSISNYQNYFEKRRQDYYTWEAFSAIETALGKIANEYPENTRLFFSPLIDYPATTQFIAPTVYPRQEALVLPDVFPLRIDADAPAVIFLHYTDDWLWQYAQTIYPNATFRIERASDYNVNHPDDQIIYYIIELTPEDIQSVQGLEENGTGILYAPEYGEYRLSAPRDVSISIDGKVIESARETIELSIGNHTISTSPPTVELEWRIPDDFAFRAIPQRYLYHTPVASHGLEGTFYPNANWQGDPEFKRIDPTLDIYFHHLPLPRPYSVVWSGWLNISEDGDYHLQIIAVENAEVLIDGRSIMTTAGSDIPANTTVRLIPRTYRIEVRYIDSSPYSRIELAWKIPGSDRYKPIAPEYFTPYRN